MGQSIAKFMYLRCFGKQVRANESGSVIAMVALGIGVLIGATALAVEMGNYSREKSRFVNAVDQAVLAVASNAASVDDPANYAREFLEANLPESGKLKSVKISVIPNADKTKWQVKASAALDTAVAKMVGVSSLELNHKAQAEWDDSVMTEVVALVDVSGTMCAKFQRDGEDGAIKFVTDRNCTKLHKMEEALRKIIDHGVAGVPENPVFKVGVVPFTYQVKLPGRNGEKVARVAPFLLKAELDAARAYRSDDPRTGDPSYFTSFTDSENNGPPLPTTYGLKTIRNEADKQDFLKHIDQIVTPGNREFNRFAWKRSTLGTQMAALMLDPRYTELFGGERPAAFGAPKTRKVAILMTDSVNLGCCFTNWPENNYTGNYIYSYSSDHKRLVGGDGKPGICQQMKDAGVEIFTVLLDVKAMDANARGGEIINAFEQCASKPEEVPDYGKWSEHALRIELNDQQSLDDAYQVIARSLLNLRLTY